MYPLRHGRISNSLPTQILSSFLMYPLRQGRISNSLPTQILCSFLMYPLRQGRSSQKYDPWVFLHISRVEQFAANVTHSFTSENNWRLFLQFSSYLLPDFLLYILSFFSTSSKFEYASNIFSASSIRKYYCYF